MVHGTPLWSVSFETWKTFDMRWEHYAPLGGENVSNLLLCYWERFQWWKVTAAVFQASNRGAAGGSVLIWATRNRHFAPRITAQKSSFIRALLADSLWHIHSPPPALALSLSFTCRRNQLMNKQGHWWEQENSQMRLYSCHRIIGLKEQSTVDHSNDVMERPLSSALWQECEHNFTTNANYGDFIQKKG